MTGNTAINALRTTVRDDYRHPQLDWVADSRLILLTAHRRENLGKPMEHMFFTIRRVVDEHEYVKELYPIHMNPAVREIVNRYLGGCDHIRLIEPMGVMVFHIFINRSYWF